MILSILDEIEKHFRVNPRAVMLTGFSGGGNPSYHTGLRHPDRVTHICTRGGNFAIQQIPRDEKSLAAGRSRIRIYIYYGESDHPLILGEGGKPGQAQQAHDALKKAGYEHVAIEKIPAMKHQSRPDIAADWFGKFLAENRKRFLAGDQADGFLEKAREAIAKEKWSRALRELRKMQKIEEKAELEPTSTEALAEVDAAGRKMVEEARAARESGDVKGALRILSRVARDFRGLPSADEAKALQKAWKE